MKCTFNLTTYSDDLDRYRDRADLLSALTGFDGLELMHCGEDRRGIVPPEKIVGVHLCFFPYWYDFYTGDLAACRRELGGEEAVRALYGGVTPEALADAYRRDIAQARTEGAEYVVFHVADCSDRELFTLRYRHTSREIAEAAAELLNTLFPETDGELVLLMENLWHPGLTLTEPEVTRTLLERVRYNNKGIMLDTAERSYSEKRLKQSRLEYRLLGSIGKPKSFDRFRIQAASCVTHDAFDLLDRIACPTLVIGGKEDRIVTGQASVEIAGRIPDCRLFLYDGLGHGLYEEAPDFLQRVADFCR